MNIDGATIHYGLGINYKGHFHPLNDNQKASLQNKLSEVKLFIIDEITMVTLILFYQINLRLIEIFGVNKPFGGLSVIVYSDFNKFPHVNPPVIYSQFELKKATVKDINGLELWYLFKMAERTEVMRQMGDTRLIAMLSKIGVGDLDDAVEFLSKSRHAVQTQISYPMDILHLFAYNAPADEQNKFRSISLIQNMLLLNLLISFQLI